MLRRADASNVLAKVAPLADTSDDPGEVARGARALRALERFQEANAAYRDAARAAPHDPAINTAWGELFLEKYKPAEAMKSFQAALQADPRWTPALIGAARALDDDNPPQAVAFAKSALEINPSSVDALVFLAGEAADAGHRDEARGSSGEGAGGEPLEPGGARAARRAVLRRRQAAGGRGRGGEDAGDRADLRRGLPRHRRSRRAQLPLR